MRAVLLRDASQLKDIVSPTRQSTSSTSGRGGEPLHAYAVRTESRSTYDRRSTALIGT